MIENQRLCDTGFNSDLERGSCIEAYRTKKLGSRINDGLSFFYKPLGLMYLYYILEGEF
jgi:hypothetical protein